MNKTIDEQVERIVLERIAKLGVDVRTNEEVKETESERFPPFVIDGILIDVGGEQTFIASLDQSYSRDVAEVALRLGYKPGDRVPYRIVVERKKD